MTHEENLKRIKEMHRELQMIRNGYNGDVKERADEAMQAVSKLHSALQPHKVKRSRKPRPAAKVVPHERDAWRAELVKKIVKKMENKQ